MISSVHIQGFRCFQDIQIDGFKAVNLIGGQNNAGKTALLEALLLAMFPYPKTLGSLRDFRGESDNLVKAAPNKLWTYFFYGQEPEKPFMIRTSGALGQKAILNVSYVNKNVPWLISNVFNLKDHELKDLLINDLPSNSVLHLNGNIFIPESKEVDFFIIPNPNTNSIGAIGKIGAEGTLPPFIHARKGREEIDLVTMFSEVRGKKLGGELSSVLKLIDERIVGVEIDAPGGESILKLVLKDESSIPVTMFGDAIRRMMEVFLVILTTNNSVLFIDEIENGLHYSKQNQIWKYLFQFARSRKIQIFATTHSLEMIRAFNEVGLQPESEDMAKYFEMSRGRKTDKIIVNPMTMEMLRYEISQNLTFRGE